MKVLAVAALLTLGAAAAVAAPDRPSGDVRDPALAEIGAEIAEAEVRLADARAALRAVGRARLAARDGLAEGRRDAFDAMTALDRIGRAPPLAFFAHPSGPQGAARAAMVLDAAAPALGARLAGLGRDHATLAGTEADAEAAAGRLRDALGALQSARLALSDRLTRPERAALAQAAREALAATDGDRRALDALLASFGGAAAERAAPPTGPVVAPVIGRVLGDFGAGGAQGVEIAAAPYALVRAPVLSVLRHVARTPGRGLTVVLEPQDGVLIAIAGLGAVDRAPGELLSAGEPLGAMGGPPPVADEFLIDATAPTGTIPDERLYIELREGGAPVDPARWFPPVAAGAGQAPAEGGAAEERTDG
jgi:septal ring factor EnvC (AmiA/AmiB activator)